MSKKINNIFKGDKVIWMVFFLLCMISIVEVFSASSELTYKKGNFLSPILYHSATLLVGTIFVVVTLNIPCRYFKLLTPFLLIISILTLIWALAAGQSANGAQRWVNLFGIQFQPSEIAKGTMVLITAQILSAMQTENGADKRAFKWVLGIASVIIFLIMLENLSTAFLLSLVILMMMFIGRVPLVQIGKLLGFVMLAAVFVVSMVMIAGDDSATENSKQRLTEEVRSQKTNFVGKVFHRFGTWKARFKKFSTEKEPTPEKYDLDKDAQVAHANIAIASCDFIGKGPGNSVERDFLSQAFSDFIFAIIIEETGIEGGVLVVFLYIILLFRTGRIASRCERNFPALLIMGLALMLVTQALFNILVAVGLVPVTGQPLPLISKGGTSTLINCIYIGVILSVSHDAKKRDEVKETKNVVEVNDATSDDNTKEIE